MIKKTLLLFMVFSLINGKTQTLTNNIFMSGITSPTKFYVGNVSSLNSNILTVTGSNAIWDASGLTRENGTPEVSLTYNAANLTPYFSNFPLSNYANYDPILTSYIAYTFINISNDSLVSYGEYSSSDGKHEIYQNPDKHLIFPFQLGGNFTDTYAKTNYSDATTISSYQTGTRSVDFAGHGTLILPQGSFTNVAYIYEMRTNSLGPNSTEYTWFDMNTGKRILYYAENNGNYTLAYSSETNTSSINEKNKNIETTIYPNISDGNFNVSSNKIISKIEIFNYNSQLIKTVNNSTNFISINSNIESGAYIVKICFDDSSVEMKRIIIKK